MSNLDRALLETVSDLIPEIRLGMTAGEWKKVAGGFSAVTKKVKINWVPCRPTQEDLELEFARGQAYGARHLDRLQLFAQRESITPTFVGDVGEPLSLGALVSRTTVEAYLANERLTCTFFAPQAPAGHVNSGTQSPELPPLPWEECSPSNGKRKGKGAPSHPWPWADWPENLLVTLLGLRQQGKPWREVAKADPKRRSSERVSHAVRRYEGWLIKQRKQHPDRAVESARIGIDHLLAGRREA